jgi:predicted esterase
MTRMNDSVLLRRISRRHFGAITGGAFVSFAFGSACGAAGLQQRDARISARPRSGVKTSASGTQSLGLGAGRDGLLHLPPKPGSGPLPLLVLLHGAGNSGAGILKRLRPYTDDAGLAVLSPDSRGSTWDAIRGGFGADVEFINRALEHVFERVDVDPKRIAVGGFSDGATYAISLGLQNGELFRRVLAFSPGFYVGGLAQGKPSIYISHGTADQILPIDRCSRVIVPALKKQGYDITFRQFDGGHEVPPNIAMAGMSWVVKS